MNNIENETKFEDVLQAWAGIFARRSMHDFLQFMHDYNLAMPHLNILMQLYYHGPASILSIRQTMQSSRAAATQLVDKLVQQGLVERTEDAADRRVKDICLSEAGRNLVRASENARKAWLDELAASYEPEEQAQLSQALQRLIDTALRQEERYFPVRAVPPQNNQSS
jgi:DNA-binding MarR family transcriptional regulator